MKLEELIMLITASKLPQETKEFVIEMIKVAYISGQAEAYNKSREILNG